jgi:hypothetical protein
LVQQACESRLQLGKLSVPVSCRARTVYRIIYEIDERRKLVSVLTIRHGAKEPAELDE